MKNLQPTIYKFANANTVRLVWVVLVVAAIVLGGGAPVAFSGGSAGGH